MSRVSESVERKRKEKADLEFKKAKADKELEATIRKKNGLNSAEEEVTENAYRNMLKN